MADLLSLQVHCPPVSSVRALQPSSTSYSPRLAIALSSDDLCVPNMEAQTQYTRVAASRVECCGTGGLSHDHVQVTPRFQRARARRTPSGFGQHS